MVYVIDYVLNNSLKKIKELLPNVLVIQRKCELITQEISNLKLYTFLVNPLR